MEDEKIIRGLDLGIARRLLRYVRPYRGWFLLALAGLIIATAAELLTPVVLQRVMDEHILVSARGYRTGTEDPAIQKVLDRAGTAPEAVGELSFLPSADWGELTGREQQDLAGRGILDSREWYLFSLPGEGEWTRLRNSHPDLFLATDSRAALPRERMGELSREELRIIRAGDFDGP